MILAPTVTSLSILVAFIPPALTWNLVKRRRVPVADQTFLDRAGIYFIGAIFSLASATLVVLVVGPVFPEAYLDFGELARISDFRNFAADNITQVYLTTITWVVLSIALAYVGARFQYRGKAATLSPHLSVWYQVLGEARGGRDVLLAIHLDDGTILEGALDAYPIDNRDDTSISLQQPIHMRPKGSDNRYLMGNLSRLIVQGDHITHIGVIYADAPET